MILGVVAGIMALCVLNVGISSVVNKELDGIIVFTVGG